MCQRELAPVYTRVNKFTPKIKEKLNNCFTKRAVTKTTTGSCKKSLPIFLVDSLQVLKNREKEKTESHRLSFFDFHSQ